MLEGANIYTYLTMLALIAVVAISLERFVTLYLRWRLKVPPFKAGLEQALAELDVNKALTIANLNPNHPVCKAAKAGLMKANGSDREVVRAMESSAMESMPKIMGKTNIVAMLGNLGTLLGLIGTVAGMIKAFEGLSNSDSGAKQEVLAKGIAIAMQSTLFGLIIAIPATFLATVFAGRQERIIDQIEEVSLSISAGLSQANREASNR